MRRLEIDIDENSVITEGFRPEVHHCSARVCYRDGYRIEEVSENRDYFWCYERQYIGATVYIHKNSIEGIRLAQLMQKCPTEFEIRDFLFPYILPRLSSEDFMELMDRKYAEGHVKGVERARYDMRKALGL